MARCLGLILVTGVFCVVDSLADSWPMRNRDMHNTGRADFVVPPARLNATFFDVIRWQKPAPCCPGDFDSTSMCFFDGAGPNGADLIAGGYHWPKGVQAMDRHTGKYFWSGNPGGGETIGRASPAFANDGRTIYVINDAWDQPLVGFPTLTGPTDWRGLADPNDPRKIDLGVGSPLVGPDGRVYSWGWNGRVAGVTDNGSSLAIAWRADAAVGTCYGGEALYEYGPDELRVISNGRAAVVRSYHGTTGATIWSRDIKFTDCPPTVDPADGRIFIPAGSADIWVIGLSKDGTPLWGSDPWARVYTWGGGNLPQVARSSGCLSHDGQTFYFQSTSERTPGSGRLWAIDTNTGAVKWSYATEAASTETWNSSPIVTSNGVLIVGNNAGGSYFALQDNDTSAILLDTISVDGTAGAYATATLSADGLLYVPLRTPWIASNGNTEIPSLNVANVFSSFDLNAGAQMYPIFEGDLPPPTDLQVTPFYSTAALQWSPVADPGVAGYVVYRRTSAGSYTVPVKRTLRPSFTDFGLTPGETYYYRVLAIDGSGTPISRLSADQATTLDTDATRYSRHKNVELLMAIYRGGYSPAQVEQMIAGLELALEFYWRTSRGQLNMDVSWLLVDGYPPGNDWGDAVQNDLRNRGVQDHQFDLAYLAANDLAGCLGGYVVFGSTPAALGTVCGTPYPANDPNVNYTITWCFTHEIHHALEVMQHLSPGVPVVLFDHFPWCYPDPLGPTGRHMDWNTQFDGIALTNRLYGDDWLLFPPPYDGYIECVDADHDGLPDHDPRVWMDEARFGSDPHLFDTDSDGLNDLAEYSAYNLRGTDPHNPDSDGDGLLDGVDPQPLYAIEGYLPALTDPPIIDGTIESAWPAWTNGYYYTQNRTDFMLRTYLGWDPNALYVAIESTRKLRFMLSIDGSGDDGRFESPERHIDSTTDPSDKPNAFGDSWADGNHIYFAHGLSFVQVNGRGTVPGAQVASTFANSTYQTELRLPRTLPKGAAYTWFPPEPNTPVVDGLTLAPGRRLGFNLTVSNYTGSDGNEFSGTWTSLFETYSLVDFVLQSPGDLNCDRLLDFNDIGPFVLALSDPAGYPEQYPHCTILNGDVNADGHVDFADISPFVALLSGGE